MPLDPSTYANLLGKKVNDHQVDCWLINTGWSGGAFGEGERMEIAYTRAIVDGVLSGHLTDVATKTDLVFGFEVPVSCEGVPSEGLQPRNTWKDGQAYDAQAKKLAAMFLENFKQFGDSIDPEIIAAGPKL